MEESKNTAAEPVDIPSGGGFPLGSVVRFTGILKLSMVVVDQFERGDSLVVSGLYVTPDGVRQFEINAALLELATND